MHYSNIYCLKVRNHKQCTDAETETLATAMNANIYEIDLAQKYT